MEPHNPQDHYITTLDTSIHNPNFVPVIPLDIDHPPTCVSSIVKHQPSHFKDYVYASSNDASSQSYSGTIYHISNFLSNSHLSPSHYRFSPSLTTQTEPKTFNEASKFECWNKAMKVELDAL